MGLTLFESTGLNQYYSLSNRFFDYIMAGIPQVCVNYPEYKRINDVYPVALMIDEVDADTIAKAINNLLDNTELCNSLQKNTLIAKEELNWEKEEIKLINYWKSICI